MVKYKIKVNDEMPWDKRKLSNGTVIKKGEWTAIPKALWNGLKLRDEAKGTNGEFDMRIEN